MPRGKVPRAISASSTPTPRCTPLVRVPGSVAPQIERRRVKIISRSMAAGRRRFYRHYLPLFPTAVELIDLDGYDLVISSSHCA